MYADLIGERAINTFWLSLVKCHFAYMQLPFHLGVLAGRYQDTILDKSIVLYSFITYAIPTFVLALIILISYLVIQLHWFPTIGSVDIKYEPGHFG